jgi:hypothetical protein
MDDEDIFEKLKKLVSINKKIPTVGEIISHYANQPFIKEFFSKKNLKLEYNKFYFISPLPESQVSRGNKISEENSNLMSNESSYKISELFSKKGLFSEKPVTLTPDEIFIKKEVFISEQNPKNKNINYHPNPNNTDTNDREIKKPKK